VVIAGLLAAACFTYGWIVFMLAEHAINLAESQRGALEHSARGSDPGNITVTTGTDRGLSQFVSGGTPAAATAHCLFSSATTERKGAAGTTRQVVTGRRDGQFMSGGL
jgi:hypothetical protein